MPGITGLHHVTVIAGDPHENLAFYTGVLGMRLVKRTVNQDVPDTYHLFYADAVGHAGTDLTFFPWPKMEAGKTGAGLTVEVALAVRPGALEYWADRLASHGIAVSAPTVRFGERTVTFDDPHGLGLALTETEDEREFTAWAGSPVPADRQVVGLHAVRLIERDLAATAQLLTEGLGFVATGAEEGWHRFVLGSGGSGRMLDVQELPASERGRWGTGSVHHVAWRVPDDETEIAVQQRVRAVGRHATEVIDRFWFKSVYFKEPGGALFEIATDGPGFTIDEEAGTLGEKLILPPWFEPDRAAIERVLPPLS